MSKTRVQELRAKIAKVDLAIDEILEAGQSMSLDDGLSYTRASLPQLNKMKKHYELQLSRATGRNPFFQSVRMG